MAGEAESEVEGALISPRRRGGAEGRMESAFERSRNSVCRSVLFLIAILFAFPASGQNCPELEAAKKKIYGFKPPTLSKEQQTATAKEMDGFWNLAKKDKNARTCLTRMLQNEPANSFFLYDGAQLLLELDPKQTTPTLETVAKAIARSDLADIEIGSYLQTVRMLDAKGVDTGELAEKYMRAPKVDAFIPQHSLQVPKPLGAVFLYGPMHPDKVDRHLIPFLQSTDEETKSSAIYILALNMSPRSLAALKELQGLSKRDQEMVDGVLTVREVRVKEKSKYTRAQILAKLAKFPDMDESDFAEGEDKEIDNSILSTLTAQDLDALRAARSRGIKGISDESLYRYFDLTRLLLGLINKHNLYAEHRKVATTK
jgi:hypothetical protein